MFHRVLDDGPTSHGLPSSYKMRGTALDREEFERVIAGVEQFITLEAVEAALARGAAPPSGVVVTFDDGYAEHVGIAQLLHERAVPATFYVASGVHADGAVAPVDAWYWLLDNSVNRTACIPLRGGGELSCRLDTLDAKAWWIDGPPKRALLAATPCEQREMIAALADSAGVRLPPDLSARLYMRRADWGELVRLGMRVGAHGVTHSLLTRAPGREMEDEIRSSVATVAELCRPVAFAYPNGEHNEAVRAMVRAAGASSGVTCESGGVLPGSDPLMLPREFVRGQSFHRYAGERRS